MAGRGGASPPSSSKILSKLPLVLACEETFEIILTGLEDTLLMFWYEIASREVSVSRDEEWESREVIVSRELRREAESSPLCSGMGAGEEEWS